jgi:hypothetical protein
MANEDRSDTRPHSGPERLVGVYRDEEEARQTAEAARAAGAEDVAIEAEEDRIAALRGEMREESEHAWGGPSVGLYTEEMAKSVPFWTVVGVVIGVVVAVPIGWIVAGDHPLGDRLFIAALCGAFFGGTVGFLVGGGFLDVRRKAGGTLASERGVVVGANERDEQVAPTMAEHDPIRVDRVAPGGQPEETVTTEEEQPNRQR